MPYRWRKAFDRVGERSSLLLPWMVRPCSEIIESVEGEDNLVVFRLAFTIVQELFNSVHNGNSCSLNPLRKSVRI